METLILTSEDIHRAVQHVGLDALMDALIERLAEACAAFDPAVTVVPERAGFAYTRPVTGLLEWMPCLRTGEHAVVKLVGYHPANARTNGCPTIVSTVSAYDTASGHLRCLMDATLLTALRTGAASAVATRVLAVPDAATLGLIGVGAQAVTQLHALTRVRPLRRVLFHDASAATAASFAGRVAAFAPDLDLEVATPTAILARADVVCTATSVGVGAGPVFTLDAAEPRPWCHFNAVGSDFPGKTELPASLLRRSLVCPDFRPQALKEGECQQLDPAALGPALPELVRDAGRYAAYRDRLTVFDSTGWALEDQVAMDLFVEVAEELGLGTRLAIEALAGDAVNPYAALTAYAPQP
ncbi:MAG: hypothetical protein R3362_06840 [Rhodothermales bacterium]|nr:hypothetical protein [Rhodothermales bacterium]